MSDQDTAPSAADFERITAELDELKDRMTRYETAGTYGDRIAATVATHLLRVEEVLTELANGVRGLNERMDTVADRVSMARNDVGAVRSSLAEVVPILGASAGAAEVETAAETPALEARAG